MLLSLNDQGDGVRTLQRHLNKLGAMLTVDARFGASVQAAIGDARQALALAGPSTSADDALQAALAAVADPFVGITAPGATFIGRVEVTSARVYREKNHVPTWPSEKSGITIGIGYDLSAVTAAQLRADWAGMIAEPDLARLATVVRVKGSAERLAAVAGISVPLANAMTVFAQKSLPEYLTRVRSIYPQVDGLSAPRQTALVSLVYNRGAQLDSDKPAVHDARREMRTIRDLLAANRLDEIPAQFENMTRLWTTPDVAGVALRRRDEATLWRSGFAALQLE